MVHGALRVIAAVAVVLGLLVTQGALAQQPDQPSAAPPQPASAQQPEQPAASPFKPEELDQILAPIALYPDELIVQILTAATYPLEIVMAARWVANSKNAALKGDALAKALEGQSWDASVKSLVPFPSVLKMMSEKLDWTQKLGDAFLSQEADCLAAVQSLRRKAAAAGTLKSTPQQKVTVQPRAAAAPAPAPTLEGPPAGANGNRGTGDRGPDDLDRSCRPAGRSTCPPTIRRPLTGPGHTRAIRHTPFPPPVRLPARYWPCHRPSLWRRRCRSRLALGLGQPQLGWRQRQHQLQPVQQHQSHVNQRQHLAAQCGAPPGCRLSRWGDPSALWPRDGRSCRPQGLPRL